MQVINESLGIYQIDLGELTMKQIREISVNWDDEDKLDGLIMFYDQETDRVLIGPGAREEQVRICLKALSDISDGTLGKLNRFSRDFQVPTNRDIAKILIQVVSVRLEKMERKEHITVPGTKFISIDGDIFQISKIVSVKSRDEAGRYFIEFYITNKRASVKKAFSNRALRDSEFERIQKVLEMVA